MKTWQTGKSKIQKSLFSTNQAPEVKEALTEFQNVLSNHIHISQDNFLPFLTRAVQQTILLVLTPYDLFNTLTRTANKHVKVAELKNEIKYLKINFKPLDQTGQTPGRKKNLTF